MTTLTVRREELEDPAYGAAEKGDAGSDPFKNGPNQNFAAIYNDGTAYLNGTPNQFTQMTHPFATGDEDARGSDDPEYAQYLAQLKKTACILNYVATLSLNAMENDYNFFDNSNFYDSLWEDDDYSFSNDLWNNDPPLDLDWNDWSNLSFGTDFGLFDRPWGDAGFSFFGGPSNDLPQNGIPSELITGSLSTDNPFAFSFSDLSGPDSPAQLWADTVEAVTGQNLIGGVAPSDTVTLNLTSLPDAGLAWTTGPDAANLNAANNTAFASTDLNQAPDVEITLADSTLAAGGITALTAPQGFSGAAATSFSLTAADITLPADDPTAPVADLDLNTPNTPAANALVYALAFSMTA